MKRRLGSALTDNEKKKARVLMNSIPQAFLSKNGITEEPVTVADMIAVCEVVHVYVSDLDPVQAERIYSRVEAVMDRA